jgi:hypothetical protein
MSIPQLFATIQREFKHATPLSNSLHSRSIRPDRIVLFYCGRTVLSNGCQSHIPTHFDQHLRSSSAGPVQHRAFHTAPLRFFFLPTSDRTVLPTITYPIQFGSSLESPCTTLGRPDHNLSQSALSAKPPPPPPPPHTRSPFVPAVTFTESSLASSPYPIYTCRPSQTCI